MISILKIDNNNGDENKRQLRQNFWSSQIFFQNLHFERAKPCILFKFSNTVSIFHRIELRGEEKVHFVASWAYFFEIFNRIHFFINFLILHETFSSWSQEKIGPSNFPIWRFFCEFHVHFFHKPFSRDHEGDAQKYNFTALGWWNEFVFKIWVRYWL